MKPIPNVEKPFSETVVDIVGLSPIIKSGNTDLLALVDQTSRYPEAINL